MGESGSLVQAAGSAAFLSPEMGEQQSRNVLADRGGQSTAKETARRNKKIGGGNGGKVGQFAKRGLKWWNRLIYQMKLGEKTILSSETFVSSFSSHLLSVQCG